MLTGQQPAALSSTGESGQPPRPPTGTIVPRSMAIKQLRNASDAELLAHRPECCCGRCEAAPLARVGHIWRVATAWSGRLPRQAASGPVATVLAAQRRTAKAIVLQRASVACGARNMLWGNMFTGSSRKSDLV